MDWPASRFEAFYEAFQKREAAESIIKHKGDMVSALFSNSAYEEDAEARVKQIENLEENCSKAIEVVYNGFVEEDPLTTDANPFMAASKRSLREAGVPDLDAFPEEEYKNPDRPEDEEEFEVDQI